MSLTAKDKAFWAKASSRCSVQDVDGLPPNQDWKDLSPGFAPVKKHGVTVMSGVVVSKIDNLTPGLLNLSELHAFTLRVDPANFKILSHNLLVVFSIMFPGDFTAEVHVAMDTFLSAVALALSEKYR